MDVPVLLIGFNRPAQTERMIDTLIAVGAKNVYVAIDGPRDGNKQDQLLCTEVQRLVNSAKWPGTIEKRYRAVNLGCRRGVSEAISWFFDHVAEGIILEDDCLPDDTFFEYCRQLLETYRENPRIGMISGSTFFPGRTGAPFSYSFSRYPHIWGWATWRRAWRKYDSDLEHWDVPGALETLERVSGGSKQFVAFWRKLIDHVKKGQIDTWDYIWSYSFWRAGFLSVSPGTNMITNIGFHEQATHTRSKPIGKSFRPKSLPLSFPLKHPKSIEPDFFLEKLTRELAMGVRGKRLRTLLRIAWLTPLKSIFR